MKIELIIAGIGAAMLVATPHHDAQAAELLIGRCHMEICSWFSIDGPSGAAESATRQYFVVCHAMSTDDDVVEDARKFGYPPTEFPPDDRKLTRPEDFIKTPASPKP